MPALSSTTISYKKVVCSPMLDYQEFDFIIRVPAVFLQLATTLVF